MGLKPLAKPVIAKISDMANAFLVINNDKMYEEIMYIGQELNSIVRKKEGAHQRLENIKFSLNRLIAAYRLLGPEKTVSTLQEIANGIDELEKQM